MPKHEHTICEVEGQVLGYDQDDIATIEFETPRDMIERAENGAVRREPGTAHLNVRITFKEGRQALWQRKDT